MGTAKCFILWSLLIHSASCQVLTNYTRHNRHWVGLKIWIDFDEEEGAGGGISETPFPTLSSTSTPILPAATTADGPSNEGLLFPH